MITMERSIADLTLSITEEIQVGASLDATFAALLEQMGPANETPNGDPLPMRIEAHPGGRWFRDLGDGNGHLWGHVQAIKRPTLLEIAGPLFMSYPVCNNLQWRLTEVADGTVLTFHHKAFGLVSDDHRSGLGEGWVSLHEKVRQRAAAS